MQLRIILILLIFFTAANTLPGQKVKKITVSGVVTDVNSKPLSGAFIMVDGKLTSTTTTSNGSYKIKILPSVTTIGIFTLMSGEAEEPLNGRTTVNFILEPPDSRKNSTPSTQTEENTGSGTSSGDNSGKLNPRFRSYETIYELIQSEYPTIIVEGKTLRIPGAVSIQWSTEPLFVVDGIQVTSVDGINPGMVKSIQVLKGSEAAIYGMKGANGVILINLLGSKDNDLRK